MKSLSETWFTEGYIDFELKRYTLLAYLQEVNKYFHQHKLYPQLADLIFHYNNIVSFRENKKYLQEKFPKQLTDINLKQLELLYERMIADDELMEELETIINYSAKKMKSTISSGAEIYESVENSLKIAPVGIIPLETSEGYMFLQHASSNQTYVYYYRITMFEKHDEKYRGIKTDYINSWQKNFVNTYVTIKSELIRQRRELPNPAVYSVETGLKYPIQETILPIAKRSLVRFISSSTV
ncbi:MAG: hypothetical protein INR73_04635 [Williamsia sp.]|nr:hypothetical protein [Williamsia sp.]